MISLSDLVDCYHSRYQNEYEVAEERFDNISKGGLQYGTF